MQNRVRRDFRRSQASRQPVLRPLTSRRPASCGCRLSKCATLASKRSMRASARQRRGHAARGVLAEHQVGGIEPGEGLLVLALDRGLHRRAERVFECDRRATSTGNSSNAGRNSTRTSARLRCACGVAARPRSDASHSPDRGRIDGAVGGEIVGETFGVELPRQRGRRRTRAGIFDRQQQCQVQVALAQGRFDRHRITPPAHVRAGQCRPLQQMVVADGEPRGAGQARLGFDETLQHATQPAGVIVSVENACCSCR